MPHTPADSSNNEEKSPSSRSSSASLTSTSSNLSTFSGNQLPVAIMTTEEIENFYRIATPTTQEILVAITTINTNSDIDEITKNIIATFTENEINYAKNRILKTHNDKTTGGFYSQNQYSENQLIANIALAVVARRIHNFNHQQCPSEEKIDENAQEIKDLRTANSKIQKIIGDYIRKSNQPHSEKDDGRNCRNICCIS